jgi:hypothetical protein
MSSTPTGTFSQKIHCRDMPWTQEEANPVRDPDVAHEPVILIRPHARLGEVVWDPNLAPPAKQETPRLRRPPAGVVPR